jgi:hypothetical protein
MLNGQVFGAKIRTNPSDVCTTKGKSDQMGIENAKLGTC